MERLVALMALALVVAVAPVAGANPAEADKAGAAQASGSGASSSSSDAPMFVPPNRGSPTTRLGGATRSAGTDALPRIEVDPETYQVRADGVLLTCEPARVLPMAQRYFLF